VSAPELVLRELGLVDYEPTLEAMKQFTDSRNADSPDELWLLQHPRVFTQGQAGKAEHVLAPGDIPVIQVDRGGQVTYHGPGQWVLYLLVDIRRHKLGVRDLVDLIEQSIVQLLSEYGIDAAAKPGAPGVYVEGVKIAALGLRVRRGCSYHGLSLNVEMDLEPFSRINPCGYAGLPVTSMAALLPDSGIEMDVVGKRLLAIVANRLRGNLSTSHSRAGGMTGLS
jgi:lipoyl(octanoyl) transferase